MTRRPCWISRFIFILGITFIIHAPVDAQVIPDDTLGAERSRLTTIPLEETTLDLIDGGAQRGQNLFHSFSQFSIDAGQQVYFVPPTEVQTILGRVTGKIPSTINGTLGVAGDANLFLLNPNGIVFGANAQLDIRGSFVGTTANAIGFGDQEAFSATAPQAPSLLTINPSALLFTQLSPNPIQVQSAPLENFGQSLLLAGGNVTVDGGRLINPGGRIELGGLAAPGTIGLTSDRGSLRMIFPATIERADISLLNTAFGVLSQSGGDLSLYSRNLDISSSVLLAGIAEGSETLTNQAGNITLDATGAIAIRNASSIINSVGSTVGSSTLGQGGDIAIAANSLALTDGSIIGSIGFGRGDLGNLSIEVQDAITLDGASAIASVVFPGGVGQAGDSTIRTGSLAVKGGSTLGSIPILAQGNSGRVSIDARDQVVLDGEDPDGNASTIVSGQILSEGKGGDLSITTGSLYVTNGAAIASGTAGKGDGGNLLINARDQVVFDGVGTGGILDDDGTLLRSKSSADSSVFFGAEGNGGNLTINTGSLVVKNGAILTSSTFGKGNAGDITINARNEVILDGSSPYGNQTIVGSAVFFGAEGEGGNIRIDSGSLRVLNGAGLTSSTYGSASNAGDITLTTGGNMTFANGGVLSTATFFGQGNAGKVFLQAGDTIALQKESGIFSGAIAFDSSAIEVLKRQGFDNQNLPELDEIAQFSRNGIGSANDISITAQSVRLEGTSSIRTSTISGNGGNVRLQSRNVLSLRGGSEISTQAGLLQLGGNGGNIEINTKFLIAIPNENSDIQANAFTGNGGSTRITAEGIFGIAPRSRLTPNSDITASSELGVQGQISIIQPDIQPTQGLLQLPADPIDASNQIAQACPRGTSDRPLGEFVVSGRGGSPPNPIDALTGTTSLSPLATLSQPSTTQAFEQDSLPLGSGGALVEAQGWVKTSDGRTMLVAQASNATPSSRPTASPCPASQLRK